MIQTQGLRQPKRQKQQQALLLSTKNQTNGADINDSLAFPSAFLQHPKKKRSTSRLKTNVVVPKLIKTFQIDASGGKIECVPLRQTLPP